MVGKHLLLAATMFVFPATSVGTFLQDAKVSPTQQSSEQPSEALAAARKELSKVRAARRTANEEFSKQWRLEQELEARIKELSAKVENPSSANAAANVVPAKVNAEGSEDVGVKSTPAMGNSEDGDGKSDSKNPCSEKISVEPLLSEPGATSKSESTETAKHNSTATAASESAANRAPGKLVIPYASAPTPTTAAPSVPSSSACRGCDENLSLAYQKCAAAHGNPCKRLAGGQMKDGLCCSRKERHDECLKCAHDGCPSAKACVSINKQYYSERSMMLQD